MARGGKGTDDGNMARKEEHAICWRRGVRSVRDVVGNGVLWNSNWTDLIRTVRPSAASSASTACCTRRAMGGWVARHGAIA
eukprot:9500579-Pyramimonas_sp.AAC.1